MGVCLIPSSMSFLYSLEWSAFKLMLRLSVNAPDVSRFLPRLKTFPNSPFPVCVLRFCCRLGPIVWFLLMVTFVSKFLQLTLSYLAKKNVCWVTSRVLVLTILCLYTYHTVFFCHQIVFFTTRLPNVPNIGAARAPKRNISPLCLRFLLPPMYQILPLTGWRLLIPKSTLPMNMPKPLIWVFLVG